MVTVLQLGVNILCYRASSNTHISVHGHGPELLKKKKKLQALRLIKFSHLYQNYASFQLCQFVLSNKSAEFNAHHLQSSQKSEAADFHRDLFIYSAKKETRDEAQIILLKKRLEIGFQRQK